MEITVICYAGYRGEETPRKLIMGARSIEVVAVQDRWLAPDHRYFKLIGDDGNLYIIRHDPQRDSWELTCYKNSPKSDPKVFVDYGSNPSACKH
jgi:hypothetical protein